MKFYQIKSTEKGIKPPRWYRLLVPSGITFSQLYVLLGFVHEEIYELSRVFYYETANGNFQIEEFAEERSNVPTRFYDVYDAKATYIDAFFKAGFRISQYTGRDFDLTIEVEKAAEEYPNLAYPMLIKVSKEIALEEGGQPDVGGMSLDLFKLTHVEAGIFRSADELIGDVGSTNLLHVSVDPVTPEESFNKGSFSKSMDRLDEALMSLREDEILARLAEQLEEDVNDKSKADPKVLAKIDNRMLQLFGMTFSEYSLFAALSEQASGNAGLPFADNKPKKPSVTTEAFINSFTSDDLQIIAEDNDVVLPAKKTKKNIAKCILQQMFTPESIRKRLVQLEDSEMDLFRLTAESEYGRFPETDKEDIDAENLVDSLLAVFLRDDRLFVTDLLRNVYEESDKDDLELERQKTVWMYKCLDIARSFYGVMSWEVLAQLYSRRFKGISRDELKRIFSRAPVYHNEFEECDDKLVLSYFIENNYYKYLEERVQQDKPFYIPSRQEIEEFYDKGCYLSSSSHQAMKRFLINKIGYTTREAEIEVAQIYHCINNNELMQTVVYRVLDGHNEGGAFNSEEEFTEFAQLYMNMNNYSHVMANRGYSPNDLFHVMGGVRSLPKEFMITPRGPEAAILLDEARDELAKKGISLDEERINSMLESEKRKKIGRNEPCPCGSGKKYKNCCGRSD